MVWSAEQKARADNAVAHIFRKYGEEVYVRRLVSTVEDPTYLEDLTRSEQEWRVIGVVNRQPSVRALEKYGRSEPVDLLVTFAWKLLEKSKIPLNGMKTIRPGDVLVLRGIRHVVVQVGPDGPKAVTTEETKTIDQGASFLELPVMAVLAPHENVNITTTPQPSQPTVLGLQILLVSPTQLLVTLSRACAFVGTPMKRIRVTKNAVVQPQASVVLTSPTLVTVTLVSPVSGGDTVLFSYNPQSVRPVTHGITAVDNGEELLGVANAAVTLT